MQSPLLRLLDKLAVRRRALAFVALALAAGVAGCKNESEAVPDAGTGYYPVAVGNSWTYAVVDTVWSEATGTVLSQVVPSVATVTSYKARETVTETFTDAIGRPAYRVKRAKMLPNATAWVDDSVYVLTANQQFVAFTRGTSRTVELVFPVREGGTWNLNAFSNNAVDPNDGTSGDALTNQTRQYSRVGVPYTTGGGGTGQPAKSYPTTLTTNDIGTATANSAIMRVGYRQIFAKGVGPVLRRRFYFANFYINGTTSVTYVPGSYRKASTRWETLTDYHVQ